MVDTEKQPQGVIAIMTSPEGHVVASEACFSRGGFGGFKLWESQRIQAKEAVQNRFVQSRLGSVVAAALSAYTKEKIVEDMISQGGYRVTCRAVGYSDDIAASVESR